MFAFEQWFEKAASQGPEREIPSSVAIAVDQDDMNHLHEIRGHPIRKPHLPSRLQTHLFGHRHVGGLLHQTPHLTSISLLQLIEPELLSLDAPIASLLPELSDPSVFTGFNSATAPEFTKPEKGVTVRMMMSHQSGVRYRAPLHHEAADCPG
ncbi:hypothetical protein VC83_08953 [Pseudogymnoascus destructans]|uniref:Beta-lactamase-related domain-containing protein n=1 Tax=Pseudogymnoascus destructans TaxID=655981 RepID=A0A177A0C1_9PEZI|nr:uncharacterized protein VC83_08953 [Pseudogymnoascus destructans]OAF54731.1 hypothetical protein VC83_08953 [Pseudogymnoascus destructans]